MNHLYELFLRGLQNFKRLFSMLITCDFRFDAAHFLTNYYGKCERLHGHTYQLRVTLRGNVQSNGLVIDFAVLKRVVKKQVLDKLDHVLLNDVIKNPSAERVVMWIWDRLKNLEPLLKEELEDPNLSEHIKKLLKKSHQKSKLRSGSFDKALRLYELQLWETPDSFVTHRPDVKG